MKRNMKWDNSDRELYVELFDNIDYSWKKDKNTNEYKMYTYYNNIRLGILEELEQRLKDLE